MIAFCCIEKKYKKREKIEKNLAIESFTIHFYKIQIITLVLTQVTVTIRMFGRMFGWIVECVYVYVLVGMVVCVCVFV